MVRVRVTIAGVSRRLASAYALSQWRGVELFSLPLVWATGEGPQTVREDRVQALHRAGPSSPPLRWRNQLGDRSQQIERLRQRLSGVPARVKPRPGRTLDRRWRTEQALRRALIAERSRIKGAKDALAKEGPDNSGKLRQSRPQGGWP